MRSLNVSMTDLRAWFAAGVTLAAATMASGCGGATPGGATLAPSAPLVSGSSSTATATPDPTSTWATVSNAEGGFSLRYPSTLRITYNCATEVWLDQRFVPTQPNCPGAGDTGELLVFYQSVAGDHRDEVGRNDGVFPSEGTASLDSGTAVTVDGVSAMRYAGTFPGGGMGVVAGEKQIVYIAYANGRTYAAIYSQKAGTPDMSADFTLMVEHTLTFNT